MFYRFKGKNTQILKFYLTDLTYFILFFRENKYLVRSKRLLYLWEYANLLIIKEPVF